MKRPFNILIEVTYPKPCVEGRDSCLEFNFYKKEAIFLQLPTSSTSFYTLNQMN